MLTKVGKLNYGAPPLPVAFLVRFLLSLRSFAPLSNPHVGGKGESAPSDSNNAARRAATATASVDLRCMWCFIGT